MDIASLSGLRALHAETLGDSRVTVAVLDGPVDVSHPCFEGADLTKLDTLVRDEPGPGPMSLHGTHVASLLFGQPGSPVTGIAPRCRGLIVPVFREGRGGHLSQLDLARAIEQAVGAGAGIINVSGGERSPDGQPAGVLEHALQICADNNVLVVAAVGNDGCECVHVPAALPSVLAVGALGLDGQPLETSNWGEAYLSNGVLAPGEKLHGAAPGAVTALLTGSSFATPLVAGVAALLASIHVTSDRPLDPVSAGRTILETARPCQPRFSPECRRHLIGTMDVASAHIATKKGSRTTVTNDDAPELSVSPATAEPSDTTMDSHEPAGVVAQAARDGTAATMSEPRIPADMVPTGQPNGLLPSSEDCSCSPVGSSYIFAIGKVGFDFGTEARRDSFRQLMPRMTVGESPPTSLPANPYDVVQLCDYLDDQPWESTRLIWTLNLDLTPIYALEAEVSYAESVYEILRAALRNQALPPEDDDYISRVSIPGTLTSRTTRLFSGQLLPVVAVSRRGLYAWEEKALVDHVVESVARSRGEDVSDDARQLTRIFLDKVYNELRNLGQSPPDRALNFAATNAFQFVEAISGGMLSASMMPGPSNNLYSLDRIVVSKSPYCRMDSDCWDVKVIFFDPEEVRRARQVIQYTIDVSDQLPVSLAPTHMFLIAP